MPKISIVIPTLNEQKLLPNLLSSLAAQTNKRFEVIVVDGQSKDMTVTIAKSFAQKLPKLQVLVSPKASLPLQRNMGARAAVSEWIAFVDADSAMFPHFVARVLEYISEEKPSLFTAWCRPDSEEPKDANVALLANMIYETSIILKRPFAPGPLTIVSRNVFTRLGGYDETCGYNEDIDFSMRAHKEHIPLHVLPETLYIWSLRRLRTQGTLKVAQQYAVSVIPILLLNRPIKFMPGYAMGGQSYKTKRKGIHPSMIKRFNARVKELVAEFLK